MALTIPPAEAKFIEMPRVPVVYEACPGFPQALGCLYDGTAYVAERGDRETLLHELGHVWIDRTLAVSDRAWFARRLGTRRLPWIADPGKRSTSEVLADAFMRCAMGWRPRRGYMEDTGYGYVPTPWQHRDICIAIQVLDLVR